MPREYNNGGKSLSNMARDVRSSFERGFFSRSDVTQFNIKLRARGMATISLDGCKEPSAAQIAIAKRQIAKEVAARKKAKPAARPAAAKPATKPSITPASMAAARAKVKAAQAKGRSR